MSVLEGKLWKKRREGDDMAIMRREGVRCLLEEGVENEKNGFGRGGGGVMKLLRSSNKNLDGGGLAVITPSISF